MDSVFCVLWLATQTWNMQCYSPPGQTKLMQVTRKMEPGLLPQQTKKFHKYMKLLLKNMKKVTKIALAVFTGSFVCLTWIYQWKQWKSYLFTNVNYIPANSHALGVSFTPAGWKLRSHAGSRLRANFSRLIEKCELLPSCLTQFSKMC